MNLKTPLVVILFTLVGVVLATPSCGGDACQALADEFASCPGGSAATSDTTGDDGVVCTDKEKMQAQCVIDAKLETAVLCKIKNGTATDAEKSPYATCYAN